MQHALWEFFHDVRGPLGRARLFALWLRRWLFRLGLAGGRRSRRGFFLVHDGTFEVFRLLIGRHVGIAVHFVTFIRSCHVR